MQSSGPVVGTVGFTYDTDFRVSAVSVNGSAASFAYDADGLVTQAGSLQVTRDAATGIATATSLGGVTDTSTVSAFGDLASHSAAYNGSGIFSEQLTRDVLGRVIEKIETIDGNTSTWDYTYDSLGRLIAVSQDGTSVASYAYDANGNRVGATIGGTPLVATYDARDRIIQYGVVTFTYTADGEVASTTTGAQTTSYTHDALGTLSQVDLPAEQVSYLIDAQGRRVGKKINGTLVQGFLYQDDLRPAAELDGSNAVVSRFVYATGRSVPDYMVKGGRTYRIVSDHVGSPRLVVDTGTGAVAQEMDFDEFGRVLVDTNPGFQPLGFAGGLYDVDTGLVLLGARNYDPNTGRWMSRDPSLFGGDSANLYAYARNNPLNAIDPSGLFSVGLSAYGVVGAGAKFAINGNGFSVCVEGGLGAGGSLEVDPFGGLDPDGTVTKAEVSVSVGAGVTSAGVKGTVSLDGAGCGKAKGEVRLGPITADIGTGSPSLKPKEGVGGLPKIEALGVKASGKVVAQRCWRANF